MDLVLRKLFIEYSSVGSFPDNLYESLKASDIEKTQSNHII